MSCLPCMNVPEVFFREQSMKSVISMRQSEKQGVYTEHLEVRKNLDIISDMLKNEKIKSVLAIIISLVMLVFAVLMAYYGYKLTQKFWNYTWTNIPSFKRGPTWTCLPICGVTSTIYLTAQIIEEIGAITKGDNK